MPPNQQRIDVRQWAHQRVDAICDQAAEVDVVESRDVEQIGIDKNGNAIRRVTPRGQLILSYVKPVEDNDAT